MKIDCGTRSQRNGTRSGMSAREAVSVDARRYDGSERVHEGLVRERPLLKRRAGRESEHCGCGGNERRLCRCVNAGCGGVGWVVGGEMDGGHAGGGGC